MNNSAVVTLRRHELRRVIATLDEDNRWAVRTASRYIAQATYRSGRHVGHVIGTADGWWWGIQPGPGKTPIVLRATNLMEACLSARAASKGAQKRDCRERWRIAGLKGAAARREGRRGSASGV